MIGPIQVTRNSGSPIGFLDRIDGPLGGDAGSDLARGLKAAIKQIGWRAGAGSIVDRHQLTVAIHGRETVPYRILAFRAADDGAPRFGDAEGGRELLDVLARFSTDHDNDFVQGTAGFEPAP